MASGQWIKGRFTVVNHPEDTDIPVGINLIPFIPPETIRFTGKKGDIYFSDMGKPLKLPDELTGLFREDCRFVILVGMGGYTGTKMEKPCPGCCISNKRVLSPFAVCLIVLRAEAGWHMPVKP